MRILHISSVNTFGGGERHLADLTRGLDERGHEVFVALRPTNEWQARLDFLPPGHIFHASIRNSFGVFSAQRIARFISEKNIDIIHAHAARDYIPASLVCRLTKNSKFVLTRHVLFPMKPFHRFALSNLARAVAVSPAVAESLRPIFPPRKIEVIPNGIDLERFSETEKQARREEFRAFHGIPADARAVGTVGELKELKGQRDFVLAAHEIAKVDDKAFFVVVGRDHSVNQQFRRELKRLAGVFGLEDRFLWLDWVDDLSGLLAALDVFVSASHSESFGLAILEAMANQTPVVATRTEGAKELLRDGETGLLVPIKEPVRLAAAVKEVLHDRPKAETFAGRARAFAAERFSLARMVEQIENMYQDILRAASDK